MHLNCFKILNFFQGLPCATTIICISLLGEGFTNLVREILDYPHPVHAWILLSRFNGNGQPVALLLPVDSIKVEIGCNTVVARTSKAEKVEGLSSSIGKYILDSLKREDADSLSSDPIILVLDKEVQIPVMPAYYLLNPGRDLPSVQREFEEWFQEHKME
ncbi:hypothetical protein OROMI_005157 [Orobanche minor]